MKILVLNGSPRKDGNTAALVEAFKEGAESAGNEVKVWNVGTMKIAGCLGCEYCHTKGAGQCVQKDDMPQLFPDMADSDIVVLASPIYYWSFTGQMQSCISRFYAPGKPAAKKYAMILSSESEGVYDAPISQYKSCISYFGAKDLGIITVAGSQNKSEAALKKVREFGAGLK